MSFNGSGVFSINTAGQPVVSATLIDSTVFNAFTADIGTGLSTCITKDGQTVLTANIPMAGFKLTGLALGSAAADSVRMSQLQSGAGATLGTIAGTNTITAVAAPVITAYASGQTFRFIPANTTTGAATINIDGLGAKNIYLGNRALVAGEIRQNVPAQIFYDGTQFQLQGPFVGGSIGSAAGTGSVAPLELVDYDCGLSLTATNTAVGAESYLIGWLKNANGTYFKTGVLAFQVTEPSATNGYGSVNIHCGGYTGGSYSDDFALTCWWKHGAEFFGADLTAASAPGLDILRISGDLQVTGSANIRGTGGSALIGASGTASAIGANINTVDIRGGATTVTGGLKLSSSDSSVVGAFYGTGSEIIIGSATSHPVVVNYASTERFRLTSTGVKFAASCRIGFFGATEVVQATNIVDADGTLADVTTKFNSLLTKFETYGLLAS